MAGISIAPLAGAFVVAVLIFGWDWTGFNRYRDRELGPNQGIRPAKTLWDWMQLILVPAVLAALGIWFNWSQRQREQLLADDRHSEATLKTYLGQISDLVIHEGLCAEVGTPEVRQVALAHTLTALERLDARRRVVIVRLLYELHLIDRDEPIIDLKGVTLNEAHQWFYALSNRGDVEALSTTGANLEDVDLRGANLERAGLGGVNLRGANLRGAYLWESELSGANLCGADLRWANLGGARLQKVVLNGAQLDHTNLRGSDLSEADLRGVKWGDGADLSHAKLFGAFVDDSSLAKARLEKADMEATVNRDMEAPVFQELTELELELGRTDGPMLENAILMSCSLRGADLRRANLRGADLTDADLRDVDLDGADLRGANLDGTDLNGANLRGAKIGYE